MMRIEALMLLGRTLEARALAEKIREAAPNHAFLGRLRGLLDASPQPLTPYSSTPPQSH